jgi:hypothetical protein
LERGFGSAETGFVGCDGGVERFEGASEGHVSTVAALRGAPFFDEGGQQRFDCRLVRRVSAF